MINRTLTFGLVPNGAWVYPGIVLVERMGRLIGSLIIYRELGEDGAAHMV